MRIAAIAVVVPFLVMNIELSDVAPIPLRKPAATGTVYAKAERRDPLAGRQDAGAAVDDIPAIPSPLFSAKAGEALPPVRYALADPQRVCVSLGIGTGQTPAWSPSPMFETEWECVGTVRPHDIGLPNENAAANALPSRKEEPSPSIFVMARGSTRDVMDYVRFKIFAASREDAVRSAQGVGLLVQRLYDTLQWSLPETVPAWLTALRPGLMDEHGTRIELLEEKSGAWRYNVILTFPPNASFRRFENSGFRILAPPRVAMDKDRTAPAPGSSHSSRNAR